MPSTSASNTDIYKQRFVCHNQFVKEKIIYYVDETGDTTFFLKGRPVNFAHDNLGVSKFFILGELKIKSDLAEVTAEFSKLKENLKKDPFIN